MAWENLSSEWPRGLSCALLFENAPDALIVLDCANHMVVINRRTEMLSGFPRPELLARPVNKLLPSAAHGEFSRLLTAAWSGATLDRIDQRLVRKDGVEVQVEIGVSRAAAQGQQFLIASLIDITQRKVEEIVQRHMMAIVDSAEDAIVTKSLDGTIRSWNPAATKLLGYAPEEIIGRPVTRLIPEDRQHEEQIILEKIRAGDRVTHFETVRRRRDGSLVQVSLMISPVHDRTGVVIGASKIMRDLTDRNATLEQLRALNLELEKQVVARTAQLRERDAMLQEIHHRVKNNLQVITSLINMQIRSMTDQATRDALRQCQSRIATMGQIHAMLYQAQNYAHIPFAGYAKELITRVMAASAGSIESVGLHLEMEDVSLPVDTAIPCGLILHELVANALKHAFSPGRQGTLRVHLRRTGNRAVLVVQDDGVGLPADFDVERHSSLGLELVTTLAHQIDGEMSIHRQAGATFQITFPVENQL